MHGFTATADEMRPLGDALAHAGFPVVGVELPGHGSEPIALAEVGYREWLACVADAVDEILRQFADGVRRVFPARVLHVRPGRLVMARANLCPAIVNGAREMAYFLLIAE